MFKFDRMFKEAIEAGTKTATFRDKQKAMKGELHAGVWVDCQVTVHRNPDFWMRVLKVGLIRLDRLDYQKFGFKSQQQMYDWAHIWYVLNPDNRVCVHEFTIEEKP